MTWKIVILFGLLLCLKVTSGANCRLGWHEFHGNCYVFIEDIPVDFTEALAFCARLNGKLVEIENAAENNFLRNFLLNNSTKSHDFWIGATDAIYETKWMWMSTMEDVQFTDWSSYSPDNYQSHQDCAMFFSPDSYHWNDNNCDTKAAFICEHEYFEGQEIIG